MRPGFLARLCGRQGTSAGSSAGFFSLIFLSALFMTNSPLAVALPVAFYGALSLLFLGCASLEYTAGDVPTRSKLEEIQVGISTKKDVRKLLGEPTHVPPLGDLTWYYMHRSSRVVAFYEPEELGWQALAFYFNENDVLLDVRLLQGEDGIKVAMNPNRTRLRGRGLSFLEQLISSYGKGSGVLPQ